MHTITRDTSDEAWAEADRLLAGIDDDTIAAVQTGLSRSESEGQRRMLELNKGNRDNLEIYPNLWAGVGLVRGGAGTALVGSHKEVADRIEEYHRLGIDEFVPPAIPISRAPTGSARVSCPGSSAADCGPTWRRPPSTDRRCPSAPGRPPREPPPSRPSYVDHHLQRQECSHDHRSR